ncbi:PucR family transcriptional regulator [Pseudonocardia sp. CA-107938]|uniref:PucR family transcriptional regulator n=1 Tax=Pseudonocardia sp. CA-107938 TaxID=3240021 RepID=UPI003D8F2C04
MSVRLTALLGHPDWAGTVVLAGDPDPVTITTVVTVTDLRAEPADAAGALLVVALVADRDDWHLDALLRRAQAAGAAAVLLPGTEPLRQVSALLAERIGLPVLGTPDPLATGLTTTRLLLLPEQLIADLVRRTAEVCATVAHGVDVLVAELARVWRRPVWLLDGTGRRVAGSEPGPGDTTPLLRAVAADGPGGSMLAVAVPPGLAAEAAAVSAAMAVATESMGARLAQERLTVERHARLRTSLLGELVQTTGDPAPATRRRAVEAGWRLDGWHLGIRIDVPTGVDAVAMRPEVLRAFAAAGLGGTVVEQGSGWAAWTTFDHEPGAAELQAHATAARSAQGVLRDSLNSAMGVGRVHAGTAGLVRTLGEAGDAARLASTRSASGHFVHVDRLGLGRMLLAWTRTDTFLPAARSMVDPLLGQPGDLLRTLTCYLDAESSLTDTAAELGVHRNTVAARVARAQELVGVDLTDPDERLALHLACRSVLFHS